MIVKSFKSFVRKICLEENGHIVLMAVFDSVDDTVLVRKALLSVRPSVGFSVHVLLCILLSDLILWFTQTHASVIKVCHYLCVSVCPCVCVCHSGSSSGPGGGV